jgi:hypothetical protein
MGNWVKKAYKPDPGERLLHKPSGAIVQFESIKGARAYDKIYFITRRQDGQVIIDRDFLFEIPTAS